MTDFFNAEKMTASEVAKRLGITPTAVRKLAREGRMPAGRKVGKKVLFIRAEIEEWANNLPSTCCHA